MGRVIIVANRLPVTAKQEEEGVHFVPSVGGLATGLRSVHAILGRGDGQDRCAGRGVKSGAPRDLLFAFSASGANISAGCFHGRKQGSR